MTLFEKIINEEIPAEFVHKDDLCVAFKDIQPAGPTHILIVPRQPIPRIAEATASEQNLLGHLLMVASTLARKLNLSQGYRIIINNGPNGGESVPHLHVHLIGGRPMAWPPG